MAEKMRTLKLVGAGERFIPDAGIVAMRNVPFQVTDTIAKAIMNHGEYEEIKLKNIKQTESED